MQTQANGSVASGESWHVSRQGTRSGPYPLEDLLQYIRAGNVVADDPVSSPSLGHWHAVPATSGQGDQGLRPGVCPGPGLYHRGPFVSPVSGLEHLP